MANVLKMHITIICFQNICNSIACNQFTICALWSRSIKKCVLCESEFLKSFSVKSWQKWILCISLFLWIYWKPVNMDNELLTVLQYVYNGMCILHTFCYLLCFYRLNRCNCFLHNRKQWSHNIGSSHHFRFVKSLISTQSHYWYLALIDGLQPRSYSVLRWNVAMGDLGSRLRWSSYWGRWPDYMSD